MYKDIGISIRLAGTASEAGGDPVPPLVRAPRAQPVPTGRRYTPMTVGDSSPMTKQYLVGELSCLLADLQPVPDDLLAAALRDLRREVEAGPPWGLDPLAERAIRLTDSICWATLERGDVAQFCKAVDAAVRVQEFTLCANLLPEIMEVKR